MFDEQIKILENKKINPHYYRLVFSSKKLSSKIVPGQFLSIKLDSSTDPFLRRPFSYYRIRGQKIEVLYEVFGKGTAILASKKAGDQFSVLGPLGKPFTRDLKGKKRIMVGGGVGVPPLVFLGETLNEKNSILLIGCKSKEHVLPKNEFLKVNADVRTTTDDGSYGKKGLVTALLEEIFESEDPSSLYVQTCGPTRMMDAVMKLCAKYGVAGEASLEERMACGVGACLGCMAETYHGFKTTCVEGPVFSFSDLAEMNV